MLEAIRGLFTLTWRQKPQYRPLPDHVQRKFVSTAGGDLELLVSSPTSPDPKAPAIFFAHGGFGCAAVWLEWMTYLRKAGYQGTTYAYSVRSHGGSYSVSYFRMVYGTSLDEVASDFKACFDFAQKLEVSEGRSGEMVLVGHSSGSGLSQYSLAKGLVRCRALFLVDGVPHFGIIPLYANWARHDPWCLLRSIFHFQHPASPLSTVNLVYGAFFGHRFPISKVADFMQWMPRYETMGWPRDMCGSFSAWWRGQPTWLNMQDILRSISGANRNQGQDAVCIMVGTEDMMIRLDEAQRHAAGYREGLSEVRTSEKSSLEERKRQSGKTIEGATVESQDGVRLAIIENAGHHVQNDVQCDIAAEALLQFVQQC